jgi:hypothetical protein
MIKASCSWGDGPDVLVTLSKEKDGISKPFLLYENPIYGKWMHGHVEEGSFDLTAKEAIKLATELIAAVGSCKDLEDQLKMYEEKRRGEENNE